MDSLPETEIQTWPSCPRTRPLHLGHRSPSLPLRFLLPGATHTSMSPNKPAPPFFQAWGTSPFLWGAWVPAQGHHRLALPHGVAVGKGTVLLPRRRTGELPPPLWVGQKEALTVWAGQCSGLTGRRAGPAPWAGRTLPGSFLPQFTDALYDWGAK